MPTLPPLPLIDDCLFIDNSGWMEGMSTCHRYLEFKSLRLRVLSGEKPSLNFGSAQHLGLELRYVRYGAGEVDPNYFNDIATLFTRFYQKHPVASEDWRTLNWAMEVNRRLNERYNMEEFNLLKYEQAVNCPQCDGSGIDVEIHIAGVEGTSSTCLFCLGTGKRSYIVELPFSCYLYTHKLAKPLLHPDGSLLNEVRVIYTGRIDLPVSKNGDPWIMDHKTTGMLGDTFWNEYRRSAQQRGYCWAWSQVTGQPVKGYIVNAIRTKEPPQYVTGGGVSKRGTRTTIEQWWNDSFSRNEFALFPGEIEAWKNNTIDLCEEFFWHYSRDYMPQKTKWCASYGKCPYFDVCNLHPDDQLLLLNSGLYTDNIWSPLNQPTQSKQ